MKWVAACRRSSRHWLGSQYSSLHNQRGVVDENELSRRVSFSKVPWVCFRLNSEVGADDTPLLHKPLSSQYVGLEILTNTSIDDLLLQRVLKISFRCGEVFQVGTCVSIHDTSIALPSPLSRRDIYQLNTLSHEIYHPPHNMRPCTYHIPRLVNPLHIQRT
jgi:hypothetical protein